MLEMIAAVSNWASAIFTLAAALIGLFFWYSDKPWVKRSIAVLALAAALFLILGIIADHFFKVREAQERITPPDLNASLFPWKKEKAFVLQIEPKNQIPFECIWAIMTEGNVWISRGIMLEWAAFNPKSNPGPYRIRIKSELEEIKGNYVKLDLTCRSAYTRFAGNPKNLELRISQDYYYDGYGLCELPIRKSRD